MSKPINEVGNRYGRLLVVERAGSTKKGRAAWRCRCDCGNVIETSGQVLRRGHTRSCGCLVKERAMRQIRKCHQGQTLPEGEASFNALLRKYKKNAEIRGREWKLSKYEFRKLVQQPCFYCGVPPLQISDRKGHNGTFLYNGLDRVDNNKGYVLENVVPCCFQCNVSKNTKSLLEFRDWVKKIYQNWGKQE